MRDNGRRRWRRWARNQRKAGTDGLTGRHAIALRNGVTTLPPTPRNFGSSPMNRVGVSNSGRKWLARVDLLKALYGEEIKTWDRRKAKRELVAWSNNLFHSEAIRLYQAARVGNRVGEKIRPCPGCIGCCTWVIREKKPGHFIGRWVPRDVPRGEDPDFDEKYLQLLDLLNTTKRAHERVDLKAICDNSGTLPAKKAVPVVRCTACGRRARCARMADGTTNRPLAWVFPEEKRPLAGLCRTCR